jgi:actin related protein 2/3 complex, subunit 1A/1B
MGDAREESALNMFRQMDLKGKAKDDTQLKTTHQNTINTIRAYDQNGGAVRKFSSKSLHLVQYRIQLTTLSQRC